MNFEYWFFSVAQKLTELQIFGSKTAVDCCQLNFISEIVDFGRSCRPLVLFFKFTWCSILSHLQKSRFFIKKIPNEKKYFRVLFHKLRVQLRHLRHTRLLASALDNDNIYFYWFFNFIFLLVKPISTMLLLAKDQFSSAYITFILGINRLQSWENQMLLLIK